MAARVIRAASLALALVATPVVAQEAAVAPGGVLRVLDKITGIVTDLDLAAGETGTVGQTGQTSRGRTPSTRRTRA